MRPVGYTMLEQKDFDSEKLTVESIPIHQGSARGITKHTSSKIQNAILLVVAVLGLAMTAGFVASKVFLWGIRALDQPELLPKNFFPGFGRITTTFEGGGDFTRNDSFGDQLWDSLVPMGGGYVRVSNPRQYGLAPSEPLQDSGLGYAEMYQASVVHQLHCMGLLRDYTHTCEGGLVPSNRKIHHAKHCIEYVRQAILCTADTTLEQSNKDGSFTAQGAVHQCRDWNLVKAFLEENRIDDSVPGILET